MLGIDFGVLLVHDEELASLALNEAEDNHDDDAGDDTVLKEDLRHHKAD